MQCEEIVYPKAIHNGLEKRELSTRLDGKDKLLSRICAIWVIDDFTTTFVSDQLVFSDCLKSLNEIVRLEGAVVFILPFTLVFSF